MERKDSQLTSNIVAEIIENSGATERIWQRTSKRRERAVDAFSTGLHYHLLEPSSCCWGEAGVPGGDLYA